MLLPRADDQGRLPALRLPVFSMNQHFCFSGVLFLFERKNIMLKMKHLVENKALAQYALRTMIRRHWRSG